MQCFLQVTLRFGLFTESQEEEHISKHCLFWNYLGYSIISFTACLQLVKVSNAFVFLEETSPKKTSTCLKSVHLNILHKFAIRLPFPVSSVIQANLHLVPARNLNIVLYLFGSDLLAQSTESQDGKNNKTNKSFNKHS